MADGFEVSDRKCNRCCGRRSVWIFFLTIFFEDGQIFLIYVDNSKLISEQLQAAEP